ncbi:MAG: 30S ribosomal protein S20 [Candidatus Saccharimonadales bacterium]
MPIIKSAKKRVKIAAKARSRNLKTKRTLRSAVRAFSEAVSSGKSADIGKAQANAVSALDMAVKKSIIHKNKAARQKAKLASLAKSAGFKPTKAAIKKPAPKKAAATKSAPRTATKKKPAKAQ